MKNKSQQHTAGAILICFMILIVSASTGFMVSKDTMHASNTKFKTEAEIGDFNHSMTITINHSQVPGDLSDFPVLFNFTDNTDLFSGCINDSGYDIAFFNSAKDTQFAHEIDYWNWDSGNSQVDAYIWVNVTSITSASDTIIYLYYGANNTVNQEDPTGVWDNNYLGVYHLSDASGSPQDSTSNNEDLSNTGCDYQEAGDIGYSMRWNVDNSDYMTCPITSQMGNDWTYEFYIKPETINSTATYLFYHENSAGNIYQYGIIWSSSTGHTRLNARTNGNTYCVLDGINSHMITTDVFTYLAYTGDENSFAKIYTNGSNVATNSSLEGNWEEHQTVTDRFDIGINSWNGLSNFYNGWIDEIRFSNIARSDNWILTTYNNLNNCSEGGFFSLQGEASTFTIKGLPNDIITFSGLPNTIVFCNDTGDTNEWLEFNMSINSTNNVTEIRVFMDDLNDTDAWVNASNITLWVSSDNSSYNYTAQTFSDGGSNISINATTWPADAGTNPFTNGAGLTDKNASVWFIFSVSIPAGTDAYDYWSSALNSCKIYAGHYV